ncbi:MAG: hypothetical protein QOI04_1463 [Verrucomicrobiota bacterium]|jgi:Tfp pilus assembly protein PilX
MTTRGLALSNKRGIALVITLSILVIATILVVGFATSMRTERNASASMANNETASLIAQSAIDNAISILDRNIPQPVPPGASTTNPSNWIINPGLLTIVQGTSSITHIPLSSNPSATYASANQDAELNVPQLSGSGYTIAPTSTPMRVAWVPVLRDPTTSASTANQIVGRYGFWVDDENAKINLNTAVGKPAATSMDFSKLTPGVISVGSSTYPLGHPSCANLDLLGTINTAGVASAVAQQGGLLSVDAIKPYVPAGTGDAFVNSNKFYLTTYSRDPEFNVFGKSKLYLFKQLVGTFTRQLGHPLFQVFRDLNAPMYFHGDEAASADTAAPYYTASNIAGILNRNDWPGMPARSFVDKWGGNAVAQREADQVAWNMVTMGSFADYGTTYTNATSGNYVKFENKIPAGQPGNTGTVNYPNAAVTIGPLSQKAIIPSFPRPLINEVCLTILLEPNQVAGITKYRLKCWLQTELWLGPGYPDCNFSAPGQAEEVGLTYLSYVVWQDNNPNATQAAPVAQEDTKYIKSTDLDGIRSLFGSATTGTMTGTSSPYTVVVTQGAPGSNSAINKWIYVRRGSGFSSSTVGPFNFEPTGMLHLDFKMRLFEHSPTPPSGSTPTAPPSSLVPVWDSRDPRSSASNTWDPTPPGTPQVPAFAPPLDDPKDYIEFKFDLDPVTFASQQVTRSLEAADPRLGGLAGRWKKATPGFDVSTTQDSNSLGALNNAAQVPTWDTKKFAFVDFSNPTGSAAGSSYRPPIGMFSLIPTGMQRGLAGSTFKLQPSGSSVDLPDWLLLDLLSPSVDAANYADLSVMNSTAGKVNLNTAIYPTGGKFNPLPRWQPLQAVFQNMSMSTTVASSASSSSPVVSNILSHSLASGGVRFRPADAVTATGYDYPGEVCEVAGVADTGASDWDKEAIIRYVASDLTTKSNVFSVWGVAQTVKKNPANNNSSNQGIFETKAGGAPSDDIVTGEKRFEAVVERYVWPGNDAIAGEGHVNASGTYDQLSTGQSQPGSLPSYAPAPSWERVDGPDALTYPVSSTSGTWNQNAAASYTSSSIEAANNPLRATMKYRIIYFKYLTD